MSFEGTNLKAGALHEPIRNRYFYGKKLEVNHFELEQDYFNAKRWLLNRLVSGFGVVCGLYVFPHDEDSVIVRPGLAIDKWGREIIVAKDSKPVKISLPQTMTDQASEITAPIHPEHKKFVHLCLEYLECEADPAPVLQNDCNGGQRSMPDTIHERYRIRVEAGKAPAFSRRRRIPRLIDGNGDIDYGVIAEWISQRCPERPEDPGIPLAQIALDKNGNFKRADIDIRVRPVLLTNDLLNDMILAITNRMAGRDEQETPYEKY